MHLCQGHERLVVGASGSEIDRYTRGKLIESRTVKASSIVLEGCIQIYSSSPLHLLVFGGHRLLGMIRGSSVEMLCPIHTRFIGSHNLPPSHHYPRYGPVGY